MAKSTLAITSRRLTTLTLIPADPSSTALVSLFDNFTGYKNRHGAVWGRGELHLFQNLRVADNAIGFTHAASAVGRAEYTSRVVNSLFVGESDNVGRRRASSRSHNAWLS